MTNPALIVEVLSQTTKNYDRGEKFEQHRQIPSFGEYLLIAQDKVHVERYLRRNDGSWILTETNDPGAVTPLFPDGLTVLSGLGQFKDPSGRTIREGARLVILLYPLDATGASENIDAIREAYKGEFEQRSVLRTDTIDCVSF